MPADTEVRPDVIEIGFLPDCGIECSICEMEIWQVPFYYKVDDASQICRSCKEREMLRE